MKQGELLRQRRFGPFFVVAFLGAFNDNVFKNALVMLVAFQGLSILGLEPGVLVALSTGLLILPFLLFSATAGQVCDRYSKSVVVRWVKVAEVPIMALGAIGMLTQSVTLLLTVLFLTGLQSTFFGPAKYSLLPEVLSDEELIGGNALIEMGTFLAILLGTIAGGSLIASFETNGPALVAVSVVLIALLGLAATFPMPRSRESAPDLQIDLNPYTPVRTILRETARERSVYLSVLGISWFWGIGAALLSLLPTYGSQTLLTSAGVVTWFLGLFCVGIGVGSLLVERMSRNGLELRLVPLGAGGMSLFIFDLFLAGSVPLGSVEAPIGLFAFLQTFTGIRVSVDLLLIAGFGGLFSVPLYTMMQRGARPEARSQVIAGSNILGALFMVATAGVVAGLLAFKADVPTVFLVFAVLNVIAVWIICRVMPQFVLHLVVWAMGNLIYRLKVRGRDHIPAEGRVVLVANHPSFIDFLLVACACRRPMRFVMYHTFYKMRWLKWLFDAGGAIPIAPAKEDAAMLERSFETIAEALENDEVVCIFPEGGVSTDGRLSPFRSGIDRILARTPAPVVPIAIQGMWGSYFSRRWGGKAMSKPFTRFWSRVQIDIAAPLRPEEASSERLAQVIAQMGGWDVPAPPEPSVDQPEIASDVG